MRNQKVLFQQPKEASGRLWPHQVDLGEPTKAEVPFVIGFGVAPENIVDSPCGKQRNVLLRPDWLALYEELVRFSDLLLVLPTSAAILGVTWQSGETSTRRVGPREFFKNLRLENETRLKEFWAAEVIRTTGRSYSITGFANNGAPALKICIRPGQSIDQFVKLVALNQGSGFGQSQHRTRGCVLPNMHFLRSHSLKESHLPTSTMERMFQHWIHDGILLRVSLTSDGISLTTHFVPKKCRREERWLYVTDGLQALHLDTSACQHLIVESGDTLSGQISVPLPDAASSFTIQIEGLS